MPVSFNLALFFVFFSGFLYRYGILQLYRSGVKFEVLFFLCPMVSSAFTDIDHSLCRGSWSIFLKCGVTARRFPCWWFFCSHCPSSLVDRKLTGRVEIENWTYFYELLEILDTKKITLGRGENIKRTLYPLILGISK